MGTAKYAADVDLHAPAMTAYMDERAARHIAIVTGTDGTGSIDKGKLAELALIDGDPQKNIGDLRQVELVMRDAR